MSMRKNDKADIIAGLRKALGDDRPLFGRESPDGKFIPDRIAFEENTPEEKERLRKLYAFHDTPGQAQGIDPLT